MDHVEKNTSNGNIQKSKSGARYRLHESARSGKLVCGEAEKEKLPVHSYRRPGGDEAGAGA
jgi:hypothetical protein